MSKLRQGERNVCPSEGGLGSGSAGMKLAGWGGPLTGLCAQASLGGSSWKENPVFPPAGPFHTMFKGREKAFPFLSCSRDLGSGASMSPLPCPPV